MASAATTHPLTVCLVGPIHGVTDFRGRFRMAQTQLEERGYAVRTPLDQAESRLPDAASGAAAPGSPVWQRALRKCLQALLGADEVWALAGWQDSQGARAEVFVAQLVGIPVREWPTGRGVGPCFRLLRSVG